MQENHRVFISSDIMQTVKNLIMTMHDLTDEATKIIHQDNNDNASHTEVPTAFYNAFNDSEDWQ